MANEKMTYSESLRIAIEALTFGDLFASFNDEQIDKIEKARERLGELKASIEKRNSSKSSSKEGTKAAADKAEKDAFRDQVREFVTAQDHSVRASEVAENFGVSVQKASAALRKLVEAGAIEKNVGEKGVSLFGRMGIEG